MRCLHGQKLLFDEQVASSQKLWWVPVNRYGPIPLAKAHESIKRFSRYAFLGLGQEINHLIVFCCTRKTLYDGERGHDERLQEASLTIQEIAESKWRRCLHVFGAWTGRRRNDRGGPDGCRPGMEGEVDDNSTSQEPLYDETSVVESAILLMERRLKSLPIIRQR